MKTWLRKPWVAACLALVAMGAVYINLIRPMLGARHSSVTALTSPAPLQALSGAQAARPVTHGVSADWPAVMAQGAASHDPFRPFTPQYSSGSAGAIGHTAKPEALRAPVVQAIVTGPTLNYAVINNHFVQKGDVVHGYRVGKITENRVDLTNRKGTVRLHLDKRKGESRQ